MVEDPESAGEAVEVYSKALAGTYEGIVAAKMGEREREWGGEWREGEKEQGKRERLTTKKKTHFFPPPFFFLLL